jgi:3-hydroxyacyl-CoA dehydrogenase
MRSSGHAPIVMKREIDGFLMNRLQGALLEEAFRLVAEGYASVEDVDIGIREGLAMRWSFIGPFETIDLNAPGGVRDYAKRYQRAYEEIFAFVAMARGLVRGGNGYDRGRTTAAPAGRPAGGAPRVARPAADGARRA